MTATLDTAALVPGTVVLDESVALRGPWSAIVAAGDVLTIIDLHGNQAVDTLIYDAHDTASRYSAPATVAGQGNLFLTTGSVLRDADGEPLMTLVGDEVGNHDTVGGAARRSPTPSATGTTPSISTHVSRTSSSKAPSGASASEIWSPTSTSS